MGAHKCDLAIIGAGIGGGALATVLARAGLEVVLLERSLVHEDRVRGEWLAPWGVDEAKTLGLYDDLLAAGGHHLARHVTYGDALEPEEAEAMALPLDTLRPGIPGPLCLGHPLTCDALNTTAVAAGATLQRGVRDVRIQAGAAPTVTYRHQGVSHELRPRLIVGADGRGSTVRRQLGLELRADPQHHLFAGLLVDDAPDWPDDLQVIATERDVHFLAFPQGGDRVRLYAGYPSDQRGRFAGPDGPARFLRDCQLESLPATRAFADATPAGPCVSYANQDTWLDIPFGEGAVLIGDAAGYNDPITGQGLSITLRDTRVVRDLLVENRDWKPQILAPYAEERGERMRRLRFAAAVQSTIECEFGAAARERRRRHFQALRTNPAHSVALLAVMAGPETLPSEAFSDASWQLIVGS